MRDPDLVQRAERAAIALERAWGRWRVMHGMTADPPPPVSSYVGYSLEEPWGQPRVVFGIAAEDAEQLTAFLDGHDCVGPVYAEVAGLSDWRRSLPSASPAGGPASVSDPAAELPEASWLPGELPGVPPQPDRPAAESLLPGETAAADDDPEQAAGADVTAETSTATAAGPVADTGAPTGVGASAQVATPAATARGAAGRGSSLGLPAAEPAAASGDKPATSILAAGGEAEASALPQPAAADVVTREPGSRARRAAGAGRGDATAAGRGSVGVEPGAAVVEAGAAGFEAAAAQGPVGRESMTLPPLTLPAADMLASRESDAHGAAGHAGSLAEAEGADSPFPALLQPGIVAFRRRQDQASQLAAGSEESVASEQQPEAAGQAPVLAAALAPSADAEQPSQGGPGYRGPRYQGYPPQYQPEPLTWQHGRGSWAPAPDDGRTDAAPAGALGPGHAPADLDRADAGLPPPEHDLPRQVSRLGRSRRSGGGAHEAGSWSQGERAATDTAV